MIISSRKSPNHGFTLLELVAVASILMILSLLTIPAFTSIKRSLDLQNAAVQTMEELRAARQSARTLNRAMEVRLYLAGVDSNEVRAIQTFKVELGGRSEEPFRKLLKFSGSASASDSSEFTTLPDLCDPVKQDEFGTYRAFRFQPNGSTNLSAGTPTITFVPTTEKDGEALPINYATVHLDPQTGTPKLFRP